MLSFENISNTYAAVHKKGYGSVSPRDLDFLQSIITQTRPRHFLEIGTASGLSTAFIALFMENCGGGNLLSLDLDLTFWEDRSKETGFLIADIYDGGKVSIDVRRGVDSSYIAEFSGAPFDGVFIDANHQHPWPTLDMIASLPFLAPRSVITHHDLALYKLQSPVVGIGPKYLFDQIPTHAKDVREKSKNIFSIQTTDDPLDFEDALADALFLPWTNREIIAETTLSRYQAIIEKHWNKKLIMAFNQGVRKFNKTA